MNDDYADADVVLNQPLAVIIPNTTTIHAVELFRDGEWESFIVAWQVIPILAWRVESSRTHNGDHLGFVNAICVEELCDPWVYELPGPTWVEPGGTWWQDFERVVAWARQELVEEHDRQVKRSAPAKTQQ